jgi:ABC-type branched-subunit amino acid transport system ATPase component
VLDHCILRWQVGVAWAQTFGMICAINGKFCTTILLVEQKVKEALRISQKVYALRMGRVVFSGTPAEIQKGDTLRKIFLV